MSPHVFHPFVKHLHAAMNSKQIPIKKKRTSIIGRTIDKAIEEQNRIGWLQALKGRLSRKWRKAEALVTEQEYTSLEVGCFPAFIRMLWETNKNVGKAVGTNINCRQLNTILT